MRLGESSLKEMLSYIIKYYEIKSLSIDEKASREMEIVLYHYLSKPNRGRLMLNNFYNIENTLLYLKSSDKTIFTFDIENIIIQSIELGDNFNTLKIKTNFEEINFEVENCGLGNDIIHTNDDYEVFIGKKIKSITVDSNADRTIEFLRIQTTCGEWLIYNLYQEEDYSSGFYSNATIFKYFKENK